MPCELLQKATDSDAERPVPLIDAFFSGHPVARILTGIQSVLLEADDLARLDDLMPFRKYQKLSALRSGMLLNYSELARDTGISVDSARRYMEYLRLSYQTFLLQPYYKNITSSTIKTPKLFWTDVGIWRQLTGYRGETSGRHHRNGN